MLVRNKPCTNVQHFVELDFSRSIDGIEEFEEWIACDLKNVLLIKFFRIFRRDFISLIKYDIIYISAYLLIEDASESPLHCVTCRLDDLLFPWKALFADNMFFILVLDFEEAVWVAGLIDSGWFVFWLLVGRWVFVLQSVLQM